MSSKTGAILQKRQGKWTQSEDQLLKRAVACVGESRWREVAEKVTGRTPLQCHNRWKQALSPLLVKGRWTPSEDEIVIAWVKENGPSRWTDLGRKLGGRLGKQCRERYVNQLDPKVAKQKPWTLEEDCDLVLHHATYGNSWATISSKLNGRSANSVKNRYYSGLRRTQYAAVKNTNPKMRRRVGKAVLQVFMEVHNASGANLPACASSTLLDLSESSNVEETVSMLSEEQAPAASSVGTTTTLSDEPATPADVSPISTRTPSPTRTARRPPRQRLPRRAKGFTTPLRTLSANVAHTPSSATPLSNTPTTWRSSSASDVAQDPNDPNDSDIVQSLQTSPKQMRITRSVSRKRRRVPTMMSASDDEESGCEPTERPPAKKLYREAQIALVNTIAPLLANMETVTPPQAVKSTPAFWRSTSMSGVIGTFLQAAAELDG